MAILRAPFEMLTLEEHPFTIPIAPTLIFSWGNPSRGDDALGSLAYEQLQQEALAKVDLLTDFQLHLEHAVDLVGREQVLFIDASVSASEPFECSPITPAKDNSYSSHAMSPQALLAVYEQAYKRPAPKAWLMAIRGYQFELGAGVSEAASINLQQSLAFVHHFCQEK